MDLDATADDSFRQRIRELHAGISCMADAAPNYE
jgi:hypothetical protein